jgi:hypothetical protein
VPKKEQHRSGLRQSRKTSAANGKTIAPSLGIKEQESDMAFTSVHPIETLLVHQLEHLLIGERELRTRYSHIGSSANTPEMRMAFSQDLAQLKDRADRLSRLMDAMNCYGPAGREERRPLTANAIA